MRVLCCNGGSSSLKLAVYEDDRAVWKGTIDGIGQPDRPASLPEALGRLLEQAGSFDAVGQRIVHGGPDLFAPTLVDDALLRRLREAIPFAPLHLPPELAVVEELRRQHPEVPQVVCFDTAFFRDLPEVAQRLPVPQELAAQGVRRYGAHGLSYEYLTERLSPQLQGRAVIAHLGNGASMAALQDCRPVNTTMGLTPAGGLVMSTRTGDLDPGVLVYALRHGHNADSLERLVNRESGLHGISGQTGDMRRLMASDRVEDRLAVEVFCYSAAMHIGALTAALGGLETLVFTGGIGEHSAVVRARICGQFGYLGLLLDEQANSSHCAVISAPESRVTVRVEPTDEDLVIARHTRRVLQRRSAETGTG